MVAIDLPTDGQPDWGGPLNAAINEINDRVEEVALNVGVGFEHTQSIAVATWTIPLPSGFPRRPNVSIYISGQQVFADVSATTNLVTIAFPSPMTGIAVLT